MRISLYTPLRPTTMRAYFASGSWQQGSWWRTMTRRQSQIPLVCNSLRDLPRIAQVFARFGEPAPALSPSIRASTRTSLLPPQPVQAGDRSFVVRHLALGIVQRISPESSPHNIFPERSGSCRTARSTNPPVMDGQGNGPPQTTLNPTIRKQLETTK